MYSAADVAHLVAEWGPLITLISTVTLAGITAWYAYLTKSLAESAHDSAEQARIAASAGRAAADAAEAAIDVRFELAPETTSTLGQLNNLLKELASTGELRSEDKVPPRVLARIMTWVGVSITCSGATVTVHGFELRSVTVAEPRQDETKMRTAQVTTFKDYALPPQDALPQLRHAGEKLQFTIADRPVGELISEISGVVKYSIGSGRVRERNVEWREKPGPSPRHP